MPKISEFHGIVIRMFHREHGPPHFHASHGEDEALIGIDPVRVLTGRLPARARRLVLEWADLYRTELVDNWEQGERNAAFNRIDPLP